MLFRGLGPLCCGEFVDCCNEKSRRNWLLEILDHACGQRWRPHFRPENSRAADNGDMGARWILSYQLGCFQAGEVRELNIHKDQMGLGRKRSFNGLSRGRSFEDLITAGLEN